MSGNKSLQEKKEKKEETEGQMGPEPQKHTDVRSRGSYLANVTNHAPGPVYPRSFALRPG